MLSIKYLYISIVMSITSLTSGFFMWVSFNTQEVINEKPKASKIVLVKVESEKIDRAGSLEKFFESYNSPLKNNAETFITVADRYGIDYKLLPSIACLESTCARFLIPETHNPFGWGGGRIYFKSYDEAIESVGKGLNEIYLSRGLDNAEKIAPVYNPPSPHTWTRGVNFFINKIEDVS